MSDVLIIGDPHVHPEYDNDRFRKLGEWLIVRKPDVIICMGDFVDFPSLSSYDRGKGTAEGRRVKKDLAHAHDALELLFAPCKAYNGRARANHKTRYLPRCWFTLGNHEDRAWRYENQEPHMDGTVTAPLMEMLESYWAFITPFRSVLEYEGVAFRHFHPTKVGRAKSGVNLARGLLNAARQSAVVGHSHILDYAQDASASGELSFGLSVGCFGHPDHKEGWSTGSDLDWWRGVVMLNGLENGYFRSLEFISMEAL